MRWLRYPRSLPATSLGREPFTEASLGVFVGNNALGRSTFQPTVDLLKDIQVVLDVLVAAALRQRLQHRCNFRLWGTHKASCLVFNGITARPEVGHRYSAAVSEFPRLAAAQSADYSHFVVRGERGAEVARLLLVDEDLDVAPDRVLLVDHAEADSRMAPLEVREQLRERRAARLDVRAAAGVVAKLRGDCDDHRHAASTE